MNAPHNPMSFSVTHLLHRASQEAEDRFARAVGSLGITPRQLVILAAVESLEEPSQTDLVHVSGIDRSTLAEMVRRLVERGWLERRRTRTDKRAYAIRLTPEGQSVLGRTLPLALKVDDDILAALPPAQCEDLSRALLAVITASSQRQS